MSATPDSTLADPQRIADLERQLAEREAELAERTAERDEALQRETATAEVLGVINSSPGDLGPVFEAILGKAHILCGAEFGSLFLYDGQHFRAIVSHGVPEALARKLREGVGANDSRSSQQLIAGAPFAHIHDSASEEHAVYRSMDMVSGHRTLLSVPLRKGDELLGMIVVGRLEVRPFTDQQIALLQNFAAQAVIAMENARLLTETREALEQQTATAEVLGVINSSPGDLAPVFDAILEKARTLCSAAHGSLSLFDGERFRAVAINTPSDKFAERLREGAAASDSPLLSTLLDGARLVHIRDLAEIDHPGARTAVELTGAHTVLWVPLRKDGVLLGLVCAVRMEIRPFSDKEIALVENFAAQAVIAMENARLIAETRDALEQQTATAEVLGVINSSPGDLAPVFDAMLEKALHLCEANFGAIATYDGEYFNFVASYGHRRFDEWLRERGPIRAAPGTTTERILNGERIVQVADAADEEVYRADQNPVRRALVDIGGFHTLLGVALRKDDVLLGILHVYRQEVRPFSDKQIALLENFAAQAVVAMENARLITETQEALEQQTATAEVLGVINASPGELGPVFDAMLEKAIRLCGAVHGTLTSYDGEHFRCVVSRNLPEALFELLRKPRRAASNSPQERLLHGESIVHIADMRALPISEDNEVARAAAEIGFTRTVLYVPLRKDDTLLGYIGVQRTEVRPFTNKQIALLQNFAAQAVIAIENARLLGELRQRTEEVAELNRGLEARVAAQVDELGRVGRLKRFLAPQLAELIVSHGDEKILESHRREIVVVFCDLRGYTAFTETAEPEEVLDFLRQYHGALGPLVSEFEGTLDQFSGDGIMVFFNDPVPCPDPAERAVKMAMAMREEAGKLIVTWRRDGCELGFGAGIAQGYATLGQIGFSERSGYTAIGTVCNLAARLCAEAKDGQILISSRVARAVEAVARLEDLGNLELKGLRRPVAAFNVVQSTSPAEPRPNLTIVARGPGV